MQKSDKIKILLIISLLIFAVILLFIRGCSKVETEKNVQKIEEKTTVKQLLPEEIKKILPNEIDSVIYCYGIKPEWIRNTTDSPAPEKPKKEKTKKTPEKNQKPPLKPQVKSENLLFSKEVTIPRDVPFAELNLEIVNLLNGYKLTSASFEDPKTYNQLFNIYYSDDTSKKVIAKIDFIYSDKIKRETADICIVLDNVDKFSHAFLEKVLSSSEKFSVMLPDDINKLDLQTIVLESKKDYLVKADIGTQDDIEAEFRNDMKEKDWRAKVRTICYEFDKAGGVILRNPKLQHKMEMELLDEFSKFPVKAYRDTVLTKYSSSESSKRKISDLFKLILSRAKNGITSQVYLVSFTEEDYGNYLSGLNIIKKRGYKFFTFSDIMKRRTKTEIKDSQQ